MQNNQNTVEFIETLTKALEAQAKVNSVLLQMLGDLKQEEENSEKETVDRGEMLSRKDKICFGNDTIKTIDIDTGRIEIKKIEYGITDYVFYLFTDNYGNVTSHYRRINIWNRDGREYIIHSEPITRRVFLDGNNDHIRCKDVKPRRCLLSEDIESMKARNKRSYKMF